MKITEKTRISELIKHNPQAVDAIASINKHFEKLKNPVLRKIMAPRVSIADAAKIGGCGVEVFFERLARLGFHYEVEAPGPVPVPENHIPEAQPTDMVKNLDVRPEIAAGGDPFNLIMEAVNNLLPEESLRIINTFEPVPLIKILEKKGFSHSTNHLSHLEVHTLFFRNGKPGPAIQTQAEALPEFEQVKELYQGKLKEIDVREMEMPMPMVTILEELENLEEERALFVYHRRVPKFLISELEDRGYKWVLQHEGEQQLNIIIYKA